VLNHEFVPFLWGVFFYPMSVNRPYPFPDIIDRTPSLRSLNIGMITKLPFIHPMMLEQ